MKIRNSFVSNSSSSSFVAVGIYNKEFIDYIVEKINIDLKDIYDNPNYENISDDIYEHKESGLEFEFNYGMVEWIGLTIDKYLLEDKKLSECKQLIKDKFKSINIPIEKSQLKLIIDSSEG